MNENFNHSFGVTELEDGTLLVQFDFGEKVKKTGTIGASGRTPWEVWSRVMGYYRPTSTWNIGKKQEFRDRQNFRPGKKAKTSRST